MSKPMRAFELTVGGVAARCWRGGEGPPLLLLHGSGPGAASQGTWRLVLEPLLARFEVFMTDLIGFGESARKPDGEPFDLGLWMSQCHALAACIEGPRYFAVGHSLSGYLALRLAAEDPRLAALVTTGTMGADFPCNVHTEQCWTFPATREDLRDTLGKLMFDRSAITEQLLDYRMSLLHDGVYGPYFSRMFAGDKQRFIRAATLDAAQLRAVRCPVLMIHGRHDVMFPAEQTTLTLAASLPRADILLLSQCAHLPATEQPHKFLQAVLPFFGQALP